MADAVQLRIRRILGVSIYALAVVRGLMEVSQANGGILFVLYALTFCWTISYWCVVDSHIVGRPIVHSFYWLIFLFWPIAVPIYLVMVRRLRGLGFALLHFVGFVVTGGVAFGLVAYFLWRQ